VGEMNSDLKKTLNQSLSSKSRPSEEDKSRTLKSVCRVLMNYLDNNLMQFLG
ncbi:unnamed protein product, partial [Schistosoma turkestanicum]